MMPYVVCLWTPKRRLALDVTAQRCSRFSLPTTKFGEGVWLSVQPRTTREQRGQTRVLFTPFSFSDLLANFPFLHRTRQLIPNARGHSSLRREQSAPGSPPLWGPFRIFIFQLTELEILQLILAFCRYFWGNNNSSVTPNGVSEFGAEVDGGWGHFSWLSFSLTLLIISLIVIFYIWTFVSLLLWWLWFFLLLPLKVLTLNVF